jgi:hypothetical protein
MSFLYTAGGFSLLEGFRILSPFLKGVAVPFLYTAGGFSLLEGFRILSPFIKGGRRAFSLYGGGIFSLITFSSIQQHTSLCSSTKKI